MEEQLSVESPATVDNVQNTLAHSFIRINNDLTGRLLNLIEALGLQDRQEKAIKKAIKSEVRNVLSTSGRDLTLLLEKFARVGVSPDMDIDQQSPKPNRSLEYYWHWSAPVEATSEE